MKDQPIASTRHRARAIASAAMGQSAAMVWNTLLGLFTAPFLIHHLGVSTYGVFALVALVSSYLMNLDFGFGQATLRFLALASAKHDEEEMATVLGNSLVIFLLAASVAFLLAFFGAPFIVLHFAHGPVVLHRTFVDSVRVGAAVIGLSILTSLGTASLQALHQLQFLIRLQWISGTTLSISSVTIVALGGGLVTVLESQVLIYVVLAVAQLGRLSRYTPAGVRPRIHRRSFREMASFSGFTMIAGVASQAISMGPGAILASYTTTAQLAAFSVPRTIINQLDNVVGSTSLGFLPYVSAASAEPDVPQVRAMYAANLRLTMIVLAPPVGFLCVFSDPLLSAWIGPSFASQAATPLRFLAVSSFFWALGPAPADLSRGFGHPRLVAIYTIVSALLTTGLSFIFVPVHHASGAALAFAVGGIVATVPFVFLAPAAVIDLRWHYLARALARPIAGLGFAFLLYACGFAIADTFASAVITGAVGTTIYVAVATRLILDHRERTILGSLFSRLSVPSRLRPPVEPAATSRHDLSNRT